MRALLFGVHIRAPDFWKLLFGFGEGSYVFLGSDISICIYWYIWWLPRIDAMARISWRSCANQLASLLATCSRSCSPGTGCSFGLGSPTVCAEFRHCYPPMVWCLCLLQALQTQARHRHRHVQLSKHTQ